VSTIKNIHWRDLHLLIIDDLIFVGYENIRATQLFNQEMYILPELRVRAR
jgi:hypothetical protein